MRVRPDLGVSEAIRRRFGGGVRFAAVGFVGMLSVAAMARGADADAARVFEEEVRPILVRRCYECHSAEAGDPEGGLALDDPRGWSSAGEHGQGIVPGSPEKSAVIAAITYRDPELQMPPERQLPLREIDVLKAWVLAGAKGASTAESAAAPRQDFAAELERRRKSHWCWSSPVRHVPGEVTDAAWPTDLVDRFVVARLESQGLRPAAPADAATWLRRVTFDLTGMPPSRGDVERFLVDDSPASREAVVDRLLASREFAECWAQHWLDLVRFAETKGHEGDYEIADAWRYRDYVIRAIASNVPYDAFVREHVAGDLVTPPRVDPETRCNESIQGTAFWHLGEATHSPVDIRADECDRIANSLDVFGKTFVALTIGCARCHDHKFDAISTEDYYALCGFLESSSLQRANVADPHATERVAGQLRQLRDDASAKVLAAYRDLVSARLTDFADELAGATAELASGSLLAASVPDRTTRIREQLRFARGVVDHPLLRLAAAPAVAGDPWPEPSPSVEPASTRTPIALFRGDQGPPANDDWITSGATFGDRPLDVGALWISIGGPSVTGPMFRLTNEPTAASWNASSKLTGLLRTRTFEMLDQPLWYRYRGVAETLVDIDSHRTIVGPLHGALKQQLDAPDGEAWFCHDLRTYAGHRAHVEFTPAGDFELLEVCFAPSQPIQARAANTAVQTVFSERDPRDARSAAGAVVEAMRRAVERAAACGAAADGDALTADETRLVNWLAEHDSLLPDPSVELAAKLQSTIAEFAREQAALEATIPPPVWALASLDGSGFDEPVHRRGQSRLRAETPTARRFLTALDGQMSIASGSGRKELADRLTDPRNPLTARVFVNRVWSHLFGRGLVGTVDNFGALGDPPTHPELLDTMAVDFVTGGWDVKALIRRLVLSRTYAMSATPDPRAVEVDPDNRLAHSARVRRMPAEAIRDAMLAVSGRLDRSSFGPSVKVHVTDFMRHHRGPTESGPLDGAGRRSIYLEVRRNAFEHFLAAFDKPTPFTTAGMRYASNTPAQSLALSNDPLVLRLASLWAADLVERFANDEQAVRDACLSAFARPATAAEVLRISQFVHAAHADSTPTSRTEAWQEVCLAIFNTKEFVFLR
ncbi:MAG: PSD1 and planctomycete cytochrome C domain-containing protein [Lacipirellulaceae bacterium]